MCLCVCVCGCVRICGGVYVYVYISLWLCSFLRMCKWVLQVCVLGAGNVGVRVCVYMCARECILARYAQV